MDRKLVLVDTLWGHFSIFVVVFLSIKENQNTNSPKINAGIKFSILKYLNESIGILINTFKNILKYYILYLM